MGYKSLLIIAVLSVSKVFAQEYERSDWRHWSDFDGDCQNTRQELLIQASLKEVSFTNERGCTVAGGRWVGPYTGRYFTLAGQVDIDHVIPLKYAHDHGGAAWSPLLKKVFANDPDNLLIVEKGANRRKGAKGPSGYLPQESFQCEYLRLWEFLAAKYELDLSPEDEALIEGRGC